MVIAAAVGVHRSMRPGPAASWGLGLLAGYGVGLVGAGVFVADPMQGFPPGTPDGPPATVSTAGLLHVVIGAIGFACLVAACFVLAHRFARRGQAGWAWHSRVTGLVFLAGFVGIASGSGSPAVVLGFWFAVVVAWAWLAALSVHLYRATPAPTGHAQPGTTTGRCSGTPARDPGETAGTRQRQLLGGAMAGLIAFVVTFLVEGATRPATAPGGTPSASSAWVPSAAGGRRLPDHRPGRPAPARRDHHRLCPGRPARRSPAAPAAGGHELNATRPGDSMLLARRRWPAGIGCWRRSRRDLSGRATGDWPRPAGQSGGAG
jgi:Protein of unknown function (DUF998)